MKCPHCTHLDSKVIDTRSTEENESIRRRRECLGCGRRFTTYETIEGLPLVVIKKDNTRQTFDRQKLIRGMLRSCEKRSVSLGQIEAAAKSIELYLLNCLEREIPSARLGVLAMDELRNIDEVAYVRFASVYRQFTDVSTFLTEVNKLLGSKTERG